jgi:hypothetical protein
VATERVYGDSTTTGQADPTPAGADHHERVNDTYPGSDATFLDFDDDEIEEHTLPLPTGSWTRIDDVTFVVRISVDLTSGVVALRSWLIVNGQPLTFRDAGPLDTEASFLEYSLTYSGVNLPSTTTTSLGYRLQRIDGAGKVYEDPIPYSE